MSLLQKISRPRVRILGTDYSPRVVGLHNRVRAHARRLLVYKDISRLHIPARIGTRGLFVPGRRRLVIYLRRGAPELTVAHELVHVLLYGEGFLPLRCRSDDLRRQPAIGHLAGRIHDLLVHPVVLERLRRSGYLAESEAPPAAEGPGEGGRRRPAAATRRGGESECLELLSLTVGAAEDLHRRPRGAGREWRRRLGALAPGLWSLAKRIARAAPWNPRRTALQSRILAAEIVGLLEEATNHLTTASMELPFRILMPPYLTRRRLEADASRLFDACIAGPASSVVVIVFRRDGAACSARSFEGAAEAKGAREAIRRELRTLSAERFIDRHRLEYLRIEGGRRYAARTGGRPTEAETLFLDAIARRR